MKPKIISIGYALPKYSYSQADIFTVLKYPHHFWRVFREADIDKRHFILPLEDIQKLSFQEQQETYLREAPKLSTKAMEACLDGLTPSDIGLVTYGSCTGWAPGPTIAHYLGREFNFSPSTFYTNIIGQGCESGFPGLKRAFDFAISTRKPALVVNCELSCLTYYPEPNGKPDPENHFELLRSNSLFGDGATSALVGFDDNWRHPTILDMETYTNTDYMGDLGYNWRNGRLRVLLSRRVPELAPLVVKPAVEAILTRNDLDITDIRWWVIHAAGNTVLDNIRDALGLPEGKVALSRETLRLVGNTSSTSVGITGKRLMSNKIKRGDSVMVLSIGPGMSGGASLCRFLGE
jgi:predicted naringenin-chalcone synthase